MAREIKNKRAPALPVDPDIKPVKPDKPTDKCCIIN
jgi:hypothetical protein